MKKNYTVCFMVTGGITVEAESKEEAMAYLDTESGQEAVGMILSGNEVTITEVLEEEDA